jgi:hypothetical protein
MIIIFLYLILTNVFKTTVYPYDKSQYTVLAFCPNEVGQLGLPRQKSKYDILPKDCGQFAFCPGISEVCPISTFARNIYTIL